MASILAGQGSAQLAAFATALSRSRDRSSERRIHALRVNTKKLRTFFRLLHAIVPDGQPPKGPHRRLKALFHSAGKRRELQVMSGLADRLSGIPEMDRKAYRSHLAVRSGKAASALERALERMRSSDLDRLAEHIAANTEGLKMTDERRGAGAFVDAQLGRARALMLEGLPEEVLHDVRKHVKNAWHTLRLLAGANALYARQKTLMGQLDTLQEHMGGWQDIHMFHSDLLDWKSGGQARKRMLVVAAKRLEHLQKKLLVELDGVLKP